MTAVFVGLASAVGLANKHQLQLSWSKCSEIKFFDISSRRGRVGAVNYSAHWPILVASASHRPVHGRLAFMRRDQTANCVNVELWFRCE